MFPRNAAVCITLYGQSVLGGPVSYTLANQLSVWLGVWITFAPCLYIQKAEFPGISYRVGQRVKTSTEWYWLAWPLEHDVAWVGGREQRASCPAYAMMIVTDCCKWTWGDHEEPRWWRQLSFILEMAAVRGSSSRKGLFWCLYDHVVVVDCVVALSW